MPSGLPRNRLIGSSVSEKTSSETVRKGFRIAARASILAPHSSEIGLFRPFRGLLRLQFGARGDFSDSLSRLLVNRGTLHLQGVSLGICYVKHPKPLYGVVGSEHRFFLSGCQENTAASA